MAKALRKYRGVDLERRRATFGEIYVWLYRRYDDLLGELTAMPHGFWAATARKMALGETRSKFGRVPSADAVQKAWVRVSLHYPEDTERFVAAREANTGHVSRRHKGWAPTSTLPHQSPAAQVSAQQTWAPGPPPPPRASSQPAPVPPDPTIPIEPGQEAPLGHPDHPLGALTTLELAKLEDYLDCSVEIQRGVLRRYRHVRHLDRFTRPGWE